jgi:small-conductance mechanosensitive channel
LLTAGWLGVGVRLLLIVVGAWLLHRLMRTLIGHLGGRSILPPVVLDGLRRTSSFLITAGAVLLALQQLGVSTTVVWTALTGFIAVGAIAFFAAWSVLSNIFCSLLIITTRLFRLHDWIEILENGEKRGLRGEVIDLNIIYTTLREAAPEGGTAAVLQIPNSLFFQRVIRRWTGPVPPQVADADDKSLGN